MLPIDLGDLLPDLVDMAFMEDRVFRDSVFSDKSVDLADSFESLSPVFDKEAGIDGDFVPERVEKVGLNVICALVAKSSGVFSEKNVKNK